MYFITSAEGRNPSTKEVYKKKIPLMRKRRRKNPQNQKS